MAAQENHPLFLSIFACIGGVAFLSFEVRSFALAAASPSKTMINMIHDGLLTPDLNDLTYHSDT